MGNSLLAHLYSHIKGSQEDIATMSLQYLISTYQPLKHEFNKLVSERLCVPVDKETCYLCQSVGDNGERPDMSGRSPDGSETILCEAKFYAGLTDNQPVMYIKRLADENGAGLMFICPRARVISLWNKLQSRVSEMPQETVSEYCISVNGINMSIISWDEILASLMRVAVAVSKESISDIEQLEGYCALMESDAFIPLKSEDLGSDMARKIERYLTLSDQVTNAILADPSVRASTNGLKATPYRHGYKRFIYIDRYGVDFRIDLELWSDPGLADTPYWICFRDADWNTTSSIINKTSGISEVNRTISGGRVYLSLVPLTDADESEVVDDMKRQIFEYLELIE